MFEIFEKFSCEVFLKIKAILESKEVSLAASECFWISD
jgi:hypothetical protein